MRVRPSILGLAIVAAFYAWVIAPNPGRHIDYEAEYCYMISVWEESDGQFGWAPYDGPKECNGKKPGE